MENKKQFKDNSDITHFHSVSGAQKNKLFTSYVVFSFPFFLFFICSADGKINPTVEFLPNGDEGTKKEQKIFSQILFRIFAIR